MRKHLPIHSAINFGNSPFSLNKKFLCSGIAAQTQNSF